MKTFTLLLSLACIFFIPKFCEAQTAITYIIPSGTSEIGVYTYFVGDNNYHRVIATAKRLYLIDRSRFGFDIFDAPDGVDITAVTVKTITRFSHFIIFFLSNGDVYRYSVEKQRTEKLGNVLSGVTKIDGDRLYALSQPNTIIASDDTAHTWFMDTVGISNFYLNDFGVDSSNNVWLATGNGLYFQTQGGPWGKITTIPLNNLSLVFVDREQRIITASANKIYISGDNGVSWKIDTAGLNNRTVIAFGDDAYGNLYAIASSVSSYKLGNTVLKSAGGTGPWVSIASVISNKTMPADKAIFSAISGDSALALATIYGLFISNDQGATWAEDNNGIQSEINNAFIESSTGRKFISTGLGIFYKDKTDTSWTKCFPPYGYVPGGPLCKDDAGNLYTLGENNYTNFLTGTTQYVNYKSANNGATWLPDTAGLSSISENLYYADETGTQHAADLCGSSLLRVFAKPVGQPWALDTTGIPYPAYYTSPTSFYSDHTGNLYLAFDDGMIYKRPVGGGAWLADTSGLNSQAYSFAQTKTGILLAGTYNTGIKQKISGKWQNLPSPYPAFSGLSCFFLSVDTSNTIIANYSYFDAYFNSIGYGVFYTKDMGVTWHSFNLDTITFKQFVSVNDTTYGVSYYNGVYAFIPTGNALALAVTDIRAYQQEAAINVEWDVTEEININKYEVQRSADGRQFTSIASVIASGKKNYSWLDASPNKNINYYRIKTIDNNGGINYSAVVKVNTAGITALNVYPNPVKGNTVTVQMENIAAGVYTLIFYDGIGHLVYARTIDHPGGSATMSIILNNLSKGVYYMQLLGRQQKFNKKMVVQ